MNLYLKRSAFSLIELMVVIAIIAATAFVAIPIYNSNINKSRVSAAIPILGGLETSAKLQFEANNTATSLTFGGITFASNTITALPIPPIVNALYVPPGGVSGVDNNSFLVCVYVDKLNFSGYVAPTAGNAGSYSRLCRLVTAGLEIYSNRCGALDGSNADIPVEYLPTGCACANVLSGSC